jgi:hypothetical protein
MAESKSTAETGHTKSSNAAPYNDTVKSESESTIPQPYAAPDCSNRAESQTARPPSQTTRTQAPQHDRLDLSDITIRTIVRLSKENQKFEEELDFTKEDLASAKRKIMLLQKCDRSKDKLMQRNLRLKATIRGHKCEEVAKKLGEEKKRADALGEALTHALERIARLEDTGKKFLDV